MAFLDDVAMMFGRAPRKPKEVSDAAEILHGRKRRAHVTQLLEEARAHPPGTTWRNRRWAVLIGVNLLFTLSFWLDIQIVEGSLTASRFLGFHLADIYSSVLVMLAQNARPPTTPHSTSTVTIPITRFTATCFCASITSTLE